MSSKSRRGRPRGRTPPAHQVTPIWVDQLDVKKHARVLLLIAMHLAKQDNTHSAKTAEHQKGGEEHDEEEGE